MSFSSDKLTQYLDTIRGQKIIIGGDFNLNTMGGNIFIDNICSLYGLEVKINGVTRIESNTCIDNYLSNVTGNYFISDTCIADHQAIIAEITTDDYLNKKKEQFIYKYIILVIWKESLSRCIHFY